MEQFLIAANVPFPLQCFPYHSKQHFAFNINSFRTDDDTSFCGQYRSRFDCTEHAV